MQMLSSKNKQGIYLKAYGHQMSLCYSLPALQKAANGVAKGHLSACKRPFFAR